jgi:S1-C subfamily serine protease
VSANTVQRVVPELIARGYYPHPWLGTEMLTLTPAYLENQTTVGDTVELTVVRDGMEQAAWVTLEERPDER